MPPSIKGRRYYVPSDQGQEAKIKENHEKREKLRNEEE
jgi:replication-associated recombination protein RarA